MGRICQVFPPVTPTTDQCDGPEVMAGVVMAMDAGEEPWTEAVVWAGCSASDAADLRRRLSHSVRIAGGQLQGDRLGSSWAASGWFGLVADLQVPGVRESLPTLRARYEQPFTMAVSASAPDSSDEIDLWVHAGTGGTAALAFAGLLSLCSPDSVTCMDPHDLRAALGSPDRPCHALLGRWTPGTQQIDLDDQARAVLAACQSVVITSAFSEVPMKSMVPFAGAARRLADGREMLYHYHRGLWRENRDGPEAPLPVVVLCA